MRIFDKLPKDMLFEFYLELFKAIIAEYRERLTNEFVSLKEETKIQVEIFDKVVLYGLAKCQEVVI